MYLDNAKGFLPNKMELRRIGMKSSTTTIHMQEWSGLVEPMNRTVIDKLLPLQREARLWQRWCGDAPLQSSILHNRTEIQCCCMKTSFELLYGKPPKIILGN